MDIITIQELWRNVHYPSPYNSYNSNFHLTFIPTENTKVCFLINKRIDSNTWKINNCNHPDIATLTIQTNCSSTTTQL